MQEYPPSPAAAAIDSARVVAEVLQDLWRTTSIRPSTTPAEVDLVLADLAEAAAALPQAARQLGDVLDQAREGHVPVMDALTETKDPDLAVDSARLHLDEIREPALEVHRRLDAAHQKTAHINATGPLEQEAETVTPRVIRLVQA